MKSPTVPASAGSLTARVTLCALIASLAASAPAQSITNYFSEGDGTDATPLDQYPSAAGNGWLAPWQSVLAANAVFTSGVSNAAPLNGGGNYLGWSIGGTTGASTVKRAFSTNNIDVTQPYTVEFDYRLDLWTGSGVPNFGQFSSGNDFVAIQMGTVNSPSSGDLQSRGSFMVRAQGGTGGNQIGLPAKTWGFFDANLSATTENLGVYVPADNIPFATNVIYRFKFTVDPLNRLYEGSVSDGVNTFSTASSGRKLRWRQFGPVYPFTTDFFSATSLNVVSRGTQATETNYQSFDNLIIQQVATNEWTPRITQVLPVRAQTFYPASSNLILNVVTYGTNTLPGTNVVLNLNGEAFTAANGLTFSDTDAANSRTVTFAGLHSNVSYEATLTAADQAGRSATFAFFFDTFVTNEVTVLEIENFNFGPQEAPCSDVQDTVQADRYIQNWAYSGISDSGPVNLANGYFMRRGVSGIDFQVESEANTGSNFRTCPPGINIRNETSDDFNRAGQLWTDGVATLRENILQRASTNMWFNYTHEWPQGTYRAYLRGGATVATNCIFELSKVTSDYTQPNQTTAPIGVFEVTGGIKREILKNRALTTESGSPLLVTLNGKETLRLTGIKGNNAANDSCFLNYMVFVPVTTLPPVEINLINPAVSGADFSFSFATTTGVSYTVQFKNDAGSTSWSTLTNFTGTGSTIIVTDALISTTNRLYRVQSP